MGGQWVIRPVVVKEYGWAIRVRDASVKQIRDLRAVGSEDVDTVLGILAQLIDSWDVTAFGSADVLPVSVESLQSLPNQVIAELLEPILEHASMKVGIRNPKPGSESTPTTPQGPEVKLQIEHP